MRPLWFGIVLLPLMVLLSARLILVAPAERQVALAMQVLLAAEREELAEVVAVEREELIVERMRRRIETMISDAGRLRVAEAAAQAELARGVSRSGSGHWVMPGETIVGNPSRSVS